MILFYNYISPSSKSGVWEVFSPVLTHLILNGDILRGWKSWSYLASKQIFLSITKQEELEPRMWTNNPINKCLHDFLWSPSMPVHCKPCSWMDCTNADGKQTCKVQKQGNPFGVINLARKVIFTSYILSMCLLMVKTWVRAWGSPEANLITGPNHELSGGRRGAQ